MLLDNMTDKNKLLLFDKLQNFSVITYNLYIIEKYLMQYSVVKARNFINLLCSSDITRFYYCYN